MTKKTRIKNTNLRKKRVLQTALACIADLLLCFAAYVASHKSFDILSFAVFAVFTLASMLFIGAYRQKLFCVVKKEIFRAVCAYLLTTLFILGFHNLFLLITDLLKVEVMEYASSELLILLYVLLATLFCNIRRFAFSVFIEKTEPRIEELLTRDEFAVNGELMDKAVSNKVVCVTGGAGSIGSELCIQALEYGCKHLVVVDYHENGMFYLKNTLSQRYSETRFSLVIATVRERIKLQEIFKKYKIDVVFHAAAYKHVPMMENCACEAIKTNLLGVSNVIDCAENAGVKNFVLVSTDKAVNPSSVMGASKRLAEMLIQHCGKDYKMKMAAVRLGNVLGSSGSVVPLFIEQIKNGGPITLTDKNVKRYFMTVTEAVRLILQTGAMANSGEIFVLDMGEPVLIYDIAKALVSAYGLRIERDIKVKYIGLREGEKLFEELRYDSEAVDTTAHAGVFVTKMQDIDTKEFKKALKDFEKLTEKEDEKGVITRIFSVVPDNYRK